MFQNWLHQIFFKKIIIGTVLYVASERVLYFIIKKFLL